MVVYKTGGWNFMDMAKLYNLLAAATIWGVTLYVVKPYKIARYLPIGLWALSIMIVDSAVHRITNIHWFTTGYIMIAGIPFFQYIFGMGAGVLMGYIIDKAAGFNEKLLAILLFTAVDMTAFYGGVYFGSVGKNPDYTIIGKIYTDLIIFSAFTWVAGYILKQTVHREKQI